jgi:hypothetical protein
MSDLQTETHNNVVVPEQLRVNPFGRDRDEGDAAASKGEEELTPRGHAGVQRALLD